MDDDFADLDDMDSVSDWHSVAETKQLERRGGKMLQKGERGTAP